MYTHNTSLKCVYIFWATVYVQTLYMPAEMPVNIPVKCPLMLSSLYPN